MFKLNKKHGVNPTMSVCFWCQEDKNEVALLGDAYKEEAPVRMVINYEPCEHCTEKMAMGITLVEGSTEPNHNPPLADGMYPTGNWCVLAEESLPYIFLPEVVEEMRENRKAMVSVEVFQLLRVNVSKDEEPSTSIH
jgi:hypothetical protein